jgi:hypothetical protein
MLLLVILPSGGFAGARIDEYVLGLMAILFAPVAGWLVWAEAIPLFSCSNS